MARLSPTKDVVRRLFAYSGNICAFPDCNEKLIDEDGDFVGQICHIEAAEANGERYNELMDDEQRRSYENLILFCYKHHVKTDDVLRYPTEVLKKLKADHESCFKNDQYSIPKDMEERLFLKLQNQIEEIHGIVKENRNMVQENNSILKETDQTTKQILAILQTRETTTLAIDEARIYSDKLAFIRELKEGGKVQTALDELNKFRANNWQDIDDELRYKVIANTASILFEMGRKEEAGDNLRQLVGINFRTPDSLSYLALGYALNGDVVNFRKVFDDPLLIGSTVTNLWVAYILLFKDTETPESLKKSIPEAVMNTPEVLFTLGEVYVEAGEYEIGFALQDSSLEKVETSKKWQLQAMVASHKLFA